jgi:serine protease Do
VTLSIIRDGKSKEIPVTLGDRKAIEKSGNSGEEEEDQNAPSAPDGKDLNLEKDYGFTVAPLTPANRHQYGIAEEAKGVVVTYVSPRSKAVDKGMIPGILITAVGRKEIDGIQEFNALSKKMLGKPLLLGVKFPGRPIQTILAIPPR